MNEHSVKQHRPDDMRPFDLPGVYSNLALIAYIERLERALDHIGGQAYGDVWIFNRQGAQEIGVGEVAGEGAPWEVSSGRGNTFLDAIEDSMGQDREIDEMIQRHRAGQEDEEAP